MVLDEQQAKEIINQSTPKWVHVAREQTRELKALIDGDDFKNVLIDKIEHIEDEKKKIARKKYSRPIIDLYERVLRLIDNVYTSQGGSKDYNITPESTLESYTKHIGDIRGGRSLQGWLENFWMPLYHSDPNGIIFLEYDSSNEIAPYPTYKSINNIRNYEADGQKMEWLLFEPKTVVEAAGGTALHFRLVDDTLDRTFVKRGETITLLEEETFDNPFGSVPGLINSNIQKIGEDIKLSPVNKIVPVTKEYARDQSIKTIFKFKEGFPLMWRLSMVCKTCSGLGKTGGKACTDCGGKGEMRKSDITDEIIVPVPDSDGLKLAPDLAGYINPPLEIWQRYDDELTLLEDICYKTHWGSIFQQENQNNQTATAKWIDTQPVIARLNKYGDVAEFMEQQLSEWIANYFLPQKNKDESVTEVFYGRQYIIVPLEAILESYQNAKEKGDNDTILDRLLKEYITSKYINDPNNLRLELIKAQTEPYVHLRIEQTLEIYGQQEAQKKGMFNEWWSIQDKMTLSDDVKFLRDQYNTWFMENKPKMLNNQINNDGKPE